MKKPSNPNASNALRMPQFKTDARMAAEYAVPRLDVIADACAHGIVDENAYSNTFAEVMREAAARFDVTPIDLDDAVSRVAAEQRREQASHGKSN